MLLLLDPHAAAAAAATYSYGQCTHALHLLPHLAPLPADLALILLDFDICVDTLAADQLKMAEPPVGFPVLQSIHYCKIVLWAPEQHR